jgi:hypothetical protein
MINRIDKSTKLARHSALSVFTSPLSSTDVSVFLSSKESQHKPASVSIDSRNPSRFVEVIISGGITLNQ